MNGLGRISNLTFDILGPVSEDVVLSKLFNSWDGYTRKKRSTSTVSTFKDADNLEYFIAIIKTVDVDGEPAPELKGKIIGHSGIGYYNDLVADGGSYVYRGADETMRKAGKENLIDTPSFRAYKPNSVYEALGKARNAHAISKLGDRSFVIAFSNDAPSFYISSPDWEIRGRNIPDWALERLDVKKGKVWAVYSPLSSGEVPRLDTKKSFNKVWQGTISKIMRIDPETHVRTLPVEQQKRKGDTCDYCERVAVLDCKRCGQKLCQIHLGKPCRPAEKREGGYRWG
jgi:hypothetical protein